MTQQKQTINSQAYHIYDLIRRFFLVKIPVYSSKLRHSADGYRLPIIMTIILVLLISGLATLRMFERTSLIGLMPGVTGGGKGYSTLLTSDEQEEFVKASTDDPEPEPDDPASSNSGTPSGSPTSFSINPGGGSSTGGSNTRPTPSTSVFSASLTFFRQDGSSLVCANPLKPNKGTCSKRYTFSGGVSTANGPGTVRYSWRSNLQDVNSSDNYSAGSGSSSKVLQKQILLSCKSPGNNSIQLVINSPTFTQSTTINFNHVCSDL